jgi:UDP-glucose 4-epimerase
MNRYLVTGGAGFIGSHIAKKLIDDGHFVRILDNFSTGRRSRVQELARSTNHDSLEVVEGDLRSFHIVRGSMNDIDYVFHQGALPSVHRSIHDPITTNDVNILGTLNVLEAARECGVRRVVYASSSSVYGNSSALPKTEDMKIEPLSPYALSKYTAERYCQIFHDVYGLETVCLRYFNVFGPDQDPDSPYSAVIVKFAKQMAAGTVPTVYGDGTQSRDFTYISNIVDANILACHSPKSVGNVYNIACGERFSLLDLVRELNVILGTHYTPIFSKKRPGDVPHSQASIAKAAMDFGYQPKIFFLAGLRMTIDRILSLQHEAH